MGWLGNLFGSGAKEAPKMEHGKEVTPMAKDPVCGMECNEKTAAASSEYNGKTYYFCATGCKKAFDKDPAKYLGGGIHEMGGHGSHKM